MHLELPLLPEAEARKAVKSRTPEDAKRIELMKALGLDAAAHTLAFDDRVRAIAMQRFKQLSREEYDYWRAYLPTSYRTDVILETRDVGRDGEVHSIPLQRKRFASYDHKDSVPLPVLELMQNHKGLFDAIEIRTPERAKVKAIRREAPDPALFGLLNRQKDDPLAFMLARWGEESPEWLTYEGVVTWVDTEEKAAKTRARDRRFRYSYEY